MGRFLCGLRFEADRGLVFLIELFSDGGQLPTFELGELDRAPALGGANERAEHQLQDSLQSHQVRGNNAGWQMRSVASRYLPRMVAGGPGNPLAIISSPQKVGSLSRSAQG